MIFWPGSSAEVISWCVTWRTKRWLSMYSVLQLWIQELSHIIHVQYHSLGLPQAAGRGHLPNIVTPQFSAILLCWWMSTIQDSVLENLETNNTSIYFHAAFHAFLFNFWKYCDKWNGETTYLGFGKKKKWKNDNFTYFLLIITKSIKICTKSQFGCPNFYSNKVLLLQNMVQR